MPAPMERLTTAAALAAATRGPPRSHRIIPPPNKPERQSASQHGGTAASPTFQKTLPRPGLIETNKSKTPAPGNTGRISGINKARKPTISFAPSFLPKANFGTENNKDQVEDFKDPKTPFRHRALSDQRVFSPTHNHNLSQLMTSSHRGKQRRAPGGKLAKRLSTLRNNTKCDAIRLFHSSDTLAAWNNPRNKATTHTDLTILGDPNKETAAGAVEAANQKFTILCLIHNHVHKKGNNYKQPSTSHATTTNSSKNDTGGNPQTQPFYSWVTFLNTTARSVSLQIGLQVRVYDAQLITCRVDTAVDIPMKDLNNIIGGECCHPDGNKNISKSCRNILICTELCEIYSSEWPPLTTNTTAMSNSTTAIATGDNAPNDDDVPMAPFGTQPPSDDEEPTNATLHQMV